MFGGGGTQVGANVVLTADNSQYDSSMQQSAQQTNAVAAAYGNLQSRIDHGFQTAKKVSFGIAAADVVTLTGAVAAAGRLQDQMRGLAAQNQVLAQSYGNATQRMKDYSSAVDQVRRSFGDATSAASQLVQTISGFERAGSTQGLTQLSKTFEQMSQTTGENATALAQSVLTLGQTMGSTLAQAKGYSDQLVTMADASNTTATSLANFASQIAPLGRQLNMTQSQITGFAAAFSKAGQDGYRASNVFSQMTSDIAQSVQQNSPRLQQYANLLGITVQAFKALNGGQQVAGLFDAIGRQGSNSLQTLNALGYDGTTTTRVVSAVAQQSGGVGNFLRMANGAYGDNASAAGGQTLSQQFGKLTQDLEQAGEGLGSRFLPALQGVMTLVDKFAAAVASFMNGPGGALVSAFAALAVPLATVVGGLAALHGAILPLMSLIALKRSSFGTGLVEGMGFRGTGLGAQIAAGEAEDRPGVAKWYGRGAALGSKIAPNGRAQYILTGQGGRGFGGMMPPRGVSAAEQVAGEAEASAAVQAEAGGFVRGTRKVAAFGERELWRPQFEPLYQPNPLRRTPMMGGMWGAGGVGSGIAEETNESVSALQRFKAEVAQSVTSLREWVAGLRTGSTEAEAAATANAKAQEGAAEVITASSIKLSESLSADAAAAAEAAAAQKVATATLLETVAAMKAGAAAGLAGTARSVGAGGLALGGMAARGALTAGMGIMDALGGPIGLGLSALLFAPMLKGMFQGNNNSAPPSEVMGTGLSFATPAAVVNPIAQGGAGFNPDNPSAYDIFNASQGSDYSNKGVSNIQNAAQAAALYGPMWGRMSTGERQSLGADLIRKLGGGGYQAFLGQVSQGTWATGASASRMLSGMVGGNQAMYSMLAANSGQYASPGSVQLQAIAQSFLGGDMSPLQGNSWTKDPSGQSGPSLFTSTSASNSLVQSNTAHHLLWGAVNFGTKNSLTGEGQDLANALFGAPSSQQNGMLTTLLTKMSNSGIKGQSAQMNYLLQNLSEKDLTQVMSQHGLNATNDHATDLAEALKEFGRKSEPLTSALKGFGLNPQQQNDLNFQDTNDPLHYAMLLYGKGISPSQMTKMYTAGYGENTYASYLQYAGQQQSLQAPYMTNQMSLFGSNTGMGGIGINSTANPFNVLAQAQLAGRVVRNDVANGVSSATDDQNLNQTFSNLQQSTTGVIQQMKQYALTLDQMNFSSQQFRQSMQWQAEAQKRQVGYEKADEARNVQREEYSYQLQRKRGEADYIRQRKYAEQDYNLQRSRAMTDFAHQTTMMIKQASMSMMDIYQQNPAQGGTSAEFLLYNNAQQTMLMNRQESQLSSLRSMGLSTNSIQQLGLTSSTNNQELNDLFNQIQQNPALIDQLNDAVKQRLTAAGALATDASSMSYQEQVYQFKLSLDRGADDFARSMKRSAEQFDLQMERSAHDFARSMMLQDQDFQRQLARQQNEFNISVSHSWTTFTQGVQNSMHQMELSAEALTNPVKLLAQVAKGFGNSDIGKEATAFEKVYPYLLKTLDSLANILGPKPNQSPIYKVITGQMGPWTPGTNNNGGVGGGLPAAVSQRMGSMKVTSGYCLSDVETALGTPHLGGTAIDAWYHEVGHRHSMGQGAPVGAPIFWGAPHGRQKDGTIAGHVAISAGGGMMWSDDSDNRWEKKPVWPGAFGWTDQLAGVTTVANSSKGFASGAWNLPADMMANIHKGEMIIPAKIASVVRAAVTAGQVANMRTTSQPVYNHIDARSYSTTNQTNFTGDMNVCPPNADKFIAEVKAKARIKQLARPGRPS